MSQHFGCSVKAIYQKCYDIGIKLRNKYFNCSEAQLRDEIMQLHNEYPNAGSQVINK